MRCALNKLVHAVGLDAGRRLSLHAFLAPLIDNHRLRLRNGPSVAHQLIAKRWRKPSLCHRRADTGSAFALRLYRRGFNFLNVDLGYYGLGDRHRLDLLSLLAHIGLSHCHRPDFAGHVDERGQIVGTPRRRLHTFFSHAVGKAEGNSLLRRHPRFAIHQALQLVGA